jgi:hypothetical protein
MNEIKVSITRNGLLSKKITFKILNNGYDRFQWTCARYRHFHKLKVCLKITEYAFFSFEISLTNFIGEKHQGSRWRAKKSPCEGWLRFLVGQKCVTEMRKNKSKVCFVESSFGQKVRSTFPVAQYCIASLLRKTNTNSLILSL